MYDDAPSRSLKRPEAVRANAGVGPPALLQSAREGARERPSGLAGLSCRFKGKVCFDKLGRLGQAHGTET